MSNEPRDYSWNAPVWTQGPGQDPEGMLEIIHEHPINSYINKLTRLAKKKNWKEEHCVALFKEDASNRLYLLMSLCGFSKVCSNNQVYIRMINVPDEAILEKIKKHMTKDEADSLDPFNATTAKFIPVYDMTDEEREEMNILKADGSGSYVPPGLRSDTYKELDDLLKLVVQYGTKANHKCWCDKCGQSITECMNLGDVDLCDECVKKLK